MSTVRVDAPAKLTLSLRVTGVRADGYHLIDAEMVSLDWCDTVTIDPSGSGVTVSGPFAHGVPVDDTNLVARALRHVGRSAAVHIDKQLPHGGGLGGGSADAAAVLRWAGYDDVVGAATLGADVAFCLTGGRARVTGIGQHVEALPFVDMELTLMVPPVVVSTPMVYRTWDSLGGPDSQLANDLEPAAVAAYPELVAWRDRFGAATGLTPALAGSGATWFVPGYHPVGDEVRGALVVAARTRR